MLFQGIFACVVVVLISIIFDRGALKEFLKSIKCGEEMISVYDKKMIVVAMHVSIYVLLMQLKWFPMKSFCILKRSQL